ncbi:T6SS immunity protein Tdi1 domain-containing protein [Kribbella sp. NPDC049227]|uniref:T6SS immunity protein Tdi1 domain-containing protein n=1 Tax=Kribbella sp. NPDC049227 TaxID=3364113 RepID=UPI00371CA665
MGGTVPSRADVDHTIDLQLRGLDDIANMSLLDLSTNRSLGSQITWQLRGVEPGTCVIISDDLLRGLRMFDRFRAQYAPLRDTVSGGSTWQHERLAGVDGYSDLASEFAGVTFAGGLYRVHDEQSGARALTLIAEALPEFTARACPFGYDWLGRQFAVDSGRVAGGQPQVLLLEPGTGEALEVPLHFAGFHDEELIEYADAALATGFFDAWSAANGDSLPLGRNQSVGYRVPLFLGGHDTVENLELSDLEVYWSICGELRQGVRSLPPGTSINEVAMR